MRTFRSLLFALVILLFVSGCVSNTRELTRAEYRSLWSSDSMLYDADYRLDTQTESFILDSKYRKLIDEHGDRVLTGWGRRQSKDARIRIRIPISDIHRVWYYEDITIYLRDGTTLQLASGNWFIAFMNGHPTSLVKSLTESGARSGSEHDVEMALQLDDVDRITKTTVDTDWGIVAFVVGVLLGIGGAIGVMAYIGLSKMK